MLQLRELILKISYFGRQLLIQNTKIEINYTMQTSTKKTNGMLQSVKTQTKSLNTTFVNPSFSREA